MKLKFRYHTTGQLPNDDSGYAEKHVLFSGKFAEKRHDFLKNPVVEAVDGFVILADTYDWFLNGLNLDSGRIDFIVEIGNLIYQKGFFSIENIENDADRKTIKVKPEIINVTDALKTWDKELKGDSFSSQTISPYIGTIETMETMRINDNLSLSEPNPPPGMGWGKTRVRYERGSRGNEPVMRVYVDWKRQTSSFQIDNTWVFDATINAFVSPITSYESIVPITGARLLKDVFRSILNEIRATSLIEIGLKSHFFQWNEQAITINTAYEWANLNLANLMLVQASDAKRPNSSGYAHGDTWKINLEKLSKDLAILLNVEFQIEKSGANHYLRVEHCSYFSGAFMTVTSTAFQRKTKSKKINVTLLEKFQYGEGVYGTAFIPAIIENSGYQLTGEKVSKMELLSCDIAAFQNPVNAEKLDENGFLILVTRDIGGSLKLLNENTPLSFANTVPALHTWKRLTKFGKINDVIKQFARAHTESTTDITVKNKIDFAVGQVAQTDYGNFEIEGVETDIVKRISRLKFG